MHLSSRGFFDVFFHTFSDADQRKSDYFPCFFVVSNNDALTHIYTQRRFWLSETDVKRVGFAIILLVQWGILLVEQFYRFHVTFLVRQVDCSTLATDVRA